MLSLSARLKCQAGAVDSFASGGWFWLPHAPSRRVHGDLIFDDAGIQLHVTESLRGPIVRSSTTSGGPVQWATEPIVHGRLRNGKAVTLLEVSGLAMPVAAAEENWSARFALMGGLVPDDRFSRVHVAFDYLLPWARPPGILRSDLTAPLVTVDTAVSTLARGHAA